MKARFVLDESSWAGAIEASLVGALADAVERLLERLDAARDRDEPVVKHENYYETDLGDGVQLLAALFDLHCPVRLDRDLTNRLITALDRANAFDDSQLTQYDAEFHGKVRFAPGVVWAHTSRREGRHVAVFPLPLGEVPVGKVPVAVASATLEIFFVAGESQHVDFFRSVIALENADEEKFERLARSAFPALDWADNVWCGLGHLSRPYIEVRDKLVRCLGGLSDDGAACFHEFRSSGPQQLARFLSAKVGAKTSDENGATKQYPQSKRDRTRCHRGINKVFWWHVKLQPNVDRIHFLYELPSVSLAGPSEGHIVVGLFKDHCVLPN